MCRNCVFTNCNKKHFIVISEDTVVMLYCVTKKTFPYKSYFLMLLCENSKFNLKNQLNDSKIVFCWNNCSGYSQEKCFKCNLVFPKLSRLKKRAASKRFLKPR